MSSSKKIKRVLFTHIYDEAAYKELQEMLKRLPMLKKYKDTEEDVPLVSLERTVLRMQQKYGVRMIYIMQHYIGEKDWEALNKAYYSAAFKDLEKGQRWAFSIDAQSMYVLFGKAVIRLYIYSKNRTNDADSQEAFEVEV